MTVGIEMGLSMGPGAEPARLDLEELLATRLLVQGNSGSGKSHLLRRLLEQSAGLVQQVVIDPEGDFVSLSDRYGHVVVEADGDDAALQAIAARVREHRVSAVLSLEGLDPEGQMRAAAAFLGGLFDAEREHWYPVLVVVDGEALHENALGLPDDVPAREGDAEVVGVVGAVLPVSAGRAAGTSSGLAGGRGAADSACASPLRALP